MYQWKWSLNDLPTTTNGKKVFSCFSCGGGSSLGYKRAGFEVIGNVEIDKSANAAYVRNLKPKYNYCMDLRDFNGLENLPSELYALDILDGSPPCTPFSISGRREKHWGVEKKFREGQKLQTLDDLFFVFLETVKKLRPKIVIAENVKGLIQGNAKGYVNEILHGFKNLGYDVQIFQLNAALMNVPQVRERIFFIANNQKYPRLKLDFNNTPILFKDVRTAQGIPIGDGITKRRLEYLLPTDTMIADITARTENKFTGFCAKIYQDNRIAPTLTYSGMSIRACDKAYLSAGDYINVSTFPQDYDFGGGLVKYLCAMSVPPNMTANLATEIYKQWLK